MIVGLRDYVSGQGIFLPPDLAADFDEFVSKVWAALISQEFGQKARREGARESIDFSTRAQNAYKRSSEIHEVIKEKIQDRIWRSQSVADRYGGEGES